MDFQQDMFGKEILDAHNRYRAAHGVAALKWSSEAAQKAESWGRKLAKSNMFKHGEKEGLGQNIASLTTCGGIADLSAQHAVDMWYNQHKEYDFNKPGFVIDTGQFTQVIWASTTHMGAAKVSEGSRCYVVANYLPAGNLAQEFEKNVKQST